MQHSLTKVRLHRRWLPPNSHMLFRDCQTPQAEPAMLFSAYTEKNRKSYKIEKISGSWMPSNLGTYACHGLQAQNDGTTWQILWCHWKGIARTSRSRFFFFSKKKSEHTLAEVLLEDGWERVPGWESKKWLLVDVDAFFSMAGTRNKLMCKIDIEEPTRITDEVYLGCTQREKRNKQNTRDVEVVAFQQTRVIWCKHDYQSSTMTTSTTPRSNLETNTFSFIVTVRRTPVWDLCKTHKNHESSMSKKSWKSRRVDTTSHDIWRCYLDHKFVNEEHESRLHHRCAGVTRFSYSMDTELSV